MHDPSSPRLWSRGRWLVIGAIVFMVPLVMCFMGYLYLLHQDYDEIMLRELRAEDLTGTIRHLDEVRTMAARLSAATGDRAGEDRYQHHVDALDRAIKEAAAMVSESESREFLAKTNAANQALVAMELRAFELVRSHRKEDALDLLTSHEYAVQKEIYAAGLNSLVTGMNLRIGQSRRPGFRASTAWVVAALASVALLTVWIAVSRSLNHYRAARAEAEQKVRESDARFRQLAESTDQGVWFYQIDPPRLLYVNPAVERVWGSAAEEFYRRPDLWLEAIVPEDRERVRNIHDACIRTKGNVPYLVEYRITRPDGTVRWIHDRGVLLLDAAGKPDRLSGIAEDITERKRTEAEIESLNARLKQHVTELESALAESDEFAYAAAHNLRSPLRGIDGFCQVVLEEDSERLSQEGGQHLQRVRQAAQTMAGLLEALLKLSRISRMKVDRQTTDLSALAHSIADSLRRRDPMRQVEFVIPEGLVAECDTPLAQALLKELLENAWKFTTVHSQARIELGSVRQADQTLAFFVRDDGVGFDMAYADKLFVPFQHLHSPGEFPGTGIGLATVQRIVHRHGGRVWAEGAIGCGATFCFTLSPLGGNVHA